MKYVSRILYRRIPFRSLCNSSGDPLKTGGTDLYL